MSGPIALTIGLLSWNGAATLPACLNSLAAIPTDDWELVVVDNASADDSRSIIAAWCSQTLPPSRWRLIRQPRNTGYAAGMNVIAQHSHAPFLLALNQDAALHPDFWTAMRDTMEAHPETGAVCGRLYRSASLAADTPALLAAADSLKFGAGLTFDSTGHLLFRDRIVMNRHGGEIDAGQAREAGEVFGCPGSAALYRRSALDAIRRSNGDWWDARLFAYLEDVDLDYRLRRAGFTCRYVPDAVALHQPHGSGGRARASIRWRAHMNRYRLLAQHESLSSLAPDIGPLLLQEAYQCLRTTCTSPWLHLSALPFFLEWVTGQWRPLRGTPPDRRWIDTRPRWEVKRGPVPADK
ncbi:MAG: hypothetical protein GEEBNDBF_01688 [bacterium]|nr:hypothetical protein [bacterium]